MHFQQNKQNYFKNFSEFLHTQLKYNNNLKKRKTGHKVFEMTENAHHVSRGLNSFQSFNTQTEQNLIELPQDF